MDAAMNELPRTVLHLMIRITILICIGQTMVISNVTYGDGRDGVGNRNNIKNNTEEGSNGTKRAVLISPNERMATGPMITISQHAGTIEAGGNMYIETSTLRHETVSTYYEMSDSMNKSMQISTDNLMTESLYSFEKTRFSLVEDIQQTSRSPKSKDTTDTKQMLQILRMQSPSVKGFPPTSNDMLPSAISMTNTLHNKTASSKFMSPNSKDSSPFEDGISNAPRDKSLPSTGMLEETLKASYEKLELKGELNQTFGDESESKKRTSQSPVDVFLTRKENVLPSNNTFSWEELGHTANDATVSQKELAGQYVNEIKPLDMLIHISNDTAPFNASGFLTGKVTERIQAWNTSSSNNDTFSAKPAFNNGDVLAKSQNQDKSTLDIYNEGEPMITLYQYFAKNYEGLEDLNISRLFYDHKYLDSFTYKFDNVYGILSDLANPPHVNAFDVAENLTGNSYFQYDKPRSKLDILRMFNNTADLDGLVEYLKSLHVTTTETPSTTESWTSTISQKAITSDWDRILYEDYMAQYRLFTISRYVYNDVDKRIINANEIAEILNIIDNSEVNKTLDIPRNEKGGINTLDILNKYNLSLRKTDFRKSVRVDDFPVSSNAEDLRDFREGLDALYFRLVYHAYDKKFPMLDYYDVISFFDNTRSKKIFLDNAAVAIETWAYYVTTHVQEKTDYYHIGTNTTTNLIDNDDPDDTKQSRVLLFLVQNSGWAVISFNIVGPMLLGLFGSVSNIINAIVYFRMKMSREPINITFASLCLADFLCMTTLVWSGLLVGALAFPTILPSLRKTGVFSDIYECSVEGPKNTLSQISCWFTAFIAIQCCLCVLYPFKIKILLSPRLCTGSIIFIACCIFLINIPIINCRFNMIYSPRLFRVLDVTNNVILRGISILVVMVCYVIVFVKVRASRKWRQRISSAERETTISHQGISSNVQVIPTHSLAVDVEEEATTTSQTTRIEMPISDQSTVRGNISSRSSKKEKKLLKMVVVISSVFVICYTPYIFVSAFRILNPVKFIDFRFLMGSVQFILEGTNAGCNIFIFYTMSSSYNEVFLRMCWPGHRHND